MFGGCEAVCEPFQSSHRFARPRRTLGTGELLLQLGELGDDLNEEESGRNDGERLRLGFGRYLFRLLSAANLSSSCRASRILAAQPGHARQGPLGGQPAHGCAIGVALEVGGTITGEHGVGLLKRDGRAQELSPVVLAMHHPVTTALDPHGILNPGEVLPAR